LAETTAERDQAWDTEFTENRAEGTEFFGERFLIRISQRRFAAIETSFRITSEDLREGQPRMDKNGHG
jgi:hypothetical protein